MGRSEQTLTETLNKAKKYFPVPAKYEHRLIMSTELFIKLWSTETVDFEYYGIDNILNYQERNGIITISFVTMKACNEVHIKALEYVIKDKTGSVPIIRANTVNKRLKQ